MTQEQADKKKAQILQGHANISGIVTQFRSFAWLMGFVAIGYGVVRHDPTKWIIALVVFAIAGIAQMVTPRILKWINRNAEIEMAKIKVDET